jgi:hypothetical protein
VPVTTIQSRWAALAAMAVLAGGSLAACGGGGGGVAKPPPAKGGAVNAGALAAPTGKQASTDTFTATFGNALTGDVQPGPTDLTLCFGGGGAFSPQFDITFGGQVQGRDHSIKVSEKAFAAGTSTYPMPQSQVDTAPEVHVTPGESTGGDDWSLYGRYGAGTVTLAGGGGHTVTGRVDADLAGEHGSTLHVTATFRCTPKS